MLLKRLSHLLSSSDQKLIPLLESAGIKTTENIIYTPRPILLDLLSSLSEDQIDDFVDTCITLTAPTSVDGNTALEEEKGKREAIETGIWGLPHLDSLIDEWDGIGICEISGPRRVGKSLMALHATLRYLLSDLQAECQWIDTEGSFAPDRAKSILEYLGVEDPTAVLSRLMVTPCFRLDPDLYQTLDTLRENLESVEGGESSRKGRVRVLVVDQITALFKDQLVNTNSAGQAAMITAMEDIAELTYTHNLTTFVVNAHATSVPTNLSSRFSATSIKPALGSSFTFTSDITLLVQETGKLFGMVDEGERERTRTSPGLRAVVEVIKSRISPAGRWCVIETDGTVLLDVVAPPMEDEQTIRQSAGLPIGDERPAIGSLAQTLRP